MVDKIAQYIEELNPELKPIVEYVYNTIHIMFPKLAASITTREICFKDKKTIIALAPQDSYVRIDFYMGEELTDPDSNLQGGGKAIKHLKIADLTMFDKSELKKWINESLKLQ